MGVTQSRRRVTQKDIARELGVHRTTVCLALKNHPNIPEITREKVRQAAARLGYTPDPMLSALAAYRTRHRPTPLQRTVAWLTDELSDRNEGESYRLACCFKGAAASAKNLGFTLEAFDLAAFGMSARRLAGSLRTRNIAGLLVSLQTPWAGKDIFPWRNFSVVTVGCNLERPAFHCVTSCSHRAALLALSHMRACGYRRMGLAMASPSHRNKNQDYLAAYLADAFLHKEEAIVLPFQHAAYTPHDMNRWVKKTRLDAVLVTADMANLFLESGLDIPADLALACPDLSSSAPPFSGVRGNFPRAGEVALNLLVSMIQRGERGIPVAPEQVLVEGEWVPGATMPDKSTEPGGKRHRK